MISGDEAQAAYVAQEADAEAKVDRFADTWYVLQAAYDKKRGRVLDPEQVQILVGAMIEHANVNQAMAAEIHRLEQELAQLREASTKRRKIWMPK